MFQTAFIVIIATCTFSFVSGQAIIPKFSTLNVEEGLSQSSVYSIYQDKKGYIWFGTGDGLNRYDGKEVKVYKPSIKESGKAFSNFIRGKICEDSKGNIWFANETGIFCLNKLSNQVDIQYDLRDNLYNATSVVFIDDDENIWLHNFFEGFFSFNVKTKKFNLYPYPKGTTVGDFVTNMVWVANKQVIYFSLNFRGLCSYQFNVITKQYEALKLNKAAYFTCPYNKGFICITEDSIVLLNQPKYAYKSISLKINANENKHAVYAIKPDDFGRIWISTHQNGLLCYDTYKDVIYQYKHDKSKPNSLPIDICRELYIDRANNLWIGTDGGGVSRIDLKPSRFKLFPLNDGDFPALNSYFIKCFYEDEYERIWTGTLDGLNIFDPKNYTLKNYSYKPNNQYSLAGNSVGDIIKDSKGRMWIGSNLGIAIFNEKKGTFHKIDLEKKIIENLHPANVLVFKLIETSDGNFIAATRLGLIHIKNNGQNSFTTKVIHQPGFVFAIITDINETSPNNFWYISPTNGLYHFEIKNNQFVYKESFLKNIDLRCIHQDEIDKNILWIGSGIGLIKFNIQTKQAIYYGSSEGLSNSYVYGIIEDEQHHLWISTNGGLFMFDKASAKFVHYNNNYGLQSNEFNTGAYYKGKSGNIYFGGIKGFNWFKPKDLFFESQKPLVNISEIQINNSPRYNDSALYFKNILQLSYDENNVTIKIAALDFSKPEANKFEYILENWDKNYVQTNSNTIRYSKLPPGNYTFKVRTSNYNDEWSDYETLKITVLPPFYKTWWFTLLVTLLMSLLSYSIIKFYFQQKLKAKIAELKKQQEIEQERQRISREMHDDIGSGLTQISLMSDAAKRKNQTSPELDDIANTSRKLVSNMSEIIWSLNTDNKTIEQLTAYLREQLNKQLEYSNIQYSIDLAESTSTYTLSNQQKRNIILVTKEIINNAIKYSKATHIMVKMTEVNNLLLFEITDDGIGFNVENQQTGNGLRNIAYRINELEGQLTVESAPNKGASFSFSIPLK